MYIIIKKKSAFLEKKVGYRSPYLPFQSVLLLISGQDLAKKYI